jgi:hypothetical protein
MVMKSTDSYVCVTVKVQIGLWDCIKLRIAGREMRAAFAEQRQTTTDNVGANGERGGTRNDAA